MKKLFYLIILTIVISCFLIGIHLNNCFAKEFGVFSETIPGCILQDPVYFNPNACCIIGTDNDKFGSSIQLFDDDGDKKEGLVSMKSEINVVGSGGWVCWFVHWGIEWEREDIVIDMSKYVNGLLKFWIKTPIELEIGIRSGNISPGSEKSKVYLSNYCTIDNKWHEVSIPLSAFKNKDYRLDFTKIKIFFNVAKEGSTGGTVYFGVDNVRWVPFNIENIIPDKGHNDGSVSLNILGQGFETGAEIKLIDPNNLSTISGTNTLVVTSEQITTDFDLTGATLGKWNVEVKNPDGRIALLQEGLEIKERLFNIKKITPNKGYNTGVVNITIDGEGFETGAEAKLINSSDLSIISGTNTLVVTPEQITTNFNISGTPEGKWDVEVKNPDGLTTLLKKGFETRIIKPQSKGPVLISGRKVFLHRSTFIIKGVGYSPIPIGASPDMGWKFPDSNSPEINKGIYDRDFTLLKQMNCNTIRTWSEVTDYLLIKAEEYNIKVICGFWVNYNLDLTNTNIRDNVLDDFRTYVANYKDANAVLMWSIGNEQNFQNGNNTEWYSLVNEMAKAAYELEGNIYHPVTTPNGELNNIGDPNIEADDISMNYLDLWGANIYRGFSFGNLFSQYENRSSKPFWISEYGIDSWNHIENKENQQEQANYASNLWDEIMANIKNCVGGTIMAYSDEWWKYDNIMSQAPGGFELSSFPDGWSDEEYWGIMRIEDNGGNIDLIHPKIIYYTLQAKWSEAQPIVEPSKSDGGICFISSN